MKYTKEELDKLKRDPVAHRLAAMMGLNLNQIIEEEKQAIDEEQNKNKWTPTNLSNEFKNMEDEFKELHTMLTNGLDKLVEDGVLTCEEKTENGVTRKFYRTVDEKPEETTAPVEEKKEYVKPEAKEQSFLMNAEQLKTFIDNYRSLIEAEKKLSYLYGVELHDSESGFSFPGKINEIIWDFMRIIFGDENAEDIADYIFGNSNFDSVESLYEELV